MCMVCTIACVDVAGVLVVGRSGTINGHVYVYDLSTADGALRPYKLAIMECNTTIRHLAFNLDATTLLAVDDAAHVWRFDLRS